MMCHSPWGQPAGESTAMASLLHALLCSLRAMLSALAVWLQNGELWLRSGLRGLCSVPHGQHCALQQDRGWGFTSVQLDVLFQVGELKV